MIGGYCTTDRGNIWMESIFCPALAGQNKKETLKGCFLVVYRKSMIKKGS
jgi:hypothetical protein